MTLIEAITKQESGGNLYAIGDKHLALKAYGPLQIRQPCVDDVNRVFGTNYKAEDTLGNMQLSTFIFNKYLSIYATSKRLGREVTDQDRARIWNGGPSGWKHPSTLGYWRSVSKYLNSVV